MKHEDLEYEALLTPGEVAALFGVNPLTVTKWAVDGRVPFIRLPSGHRRYRASDIQVLLDRHGYGNSSSQ